VRAVRAPGANPPWRRPESPQRMLSELFRRLFRRAETAVPHSDDALTVAARRLEAGDFAAAARGALRLIDQQPGNPYAHIVLARAQVGSGDLQAARDALDKALEADATLDLLWAERAELERRTGRAEAAIAIYRRGLAQHAGSVALSGNLGGLLGEEGRLDEAVATLTEAANLNPDSAAIQFSLGRALTARGDLAEAERRLRRAIALEPDKRSRRFWLAHVLLMQGRLAEGWAEYESRLEAPGFTWGVAGLPRWDGADPRGKRLRVIAEQGLGDSIMFARFITRLLERGARVQFLCRGNMVRLFQASFDPAEVEVTADPDAEAAGVDAHVHLMSLPHLLKVPREALRTHGPYLRIPAELAAEWRARVMQSPGGSGAALEVGLMWSGNPDRSRDENRSLPIEVAQRLGEAAGPIAWFNLQVDTERSRSTGQPFSMVDLTSGMRDYADSMGLIAAMDLVISVDTSTAHATAALGKPLWLIAPHDVCWRWVIAGEESPWYDGVRIFRAARPRDWAPVVARLARELAGIAARKAL
jgi:tetratricopeptide (TPR) repeat protein